MMYTLLLLYAGTLTRKDSSRWSTTLLYTLHCTGSGQSSIRQMLAKDSYARKVQNMVRFGSYVCFEATPYIPFASKLKT